MKRIIKKFLRDRYPVTRLLKSWWVAIFDSISGIRDTYAQSDEDMNIARLLNERQITNRFYIDVGANHPTKLSNTYRLYREGYSGLIIEPNRRLLLLHRIFRPRDIQLGIGCGAEAAVLSFQHAINHVLSGFQSEGIKTQDFRTTELMPVLPLDLVTAALPDEEFAVLSIDVEGFDLQVVLGATETLKRTRFVVIEGSESDAELMEPFAKANFVLIEKTKHNLIFERKVAE
jgi:FkbM family methyltransferase